MEYTALELTQHFTTTGKTLDVRKCEVCKKIKDANEFKKIEKVFVCSCCKDKYLNELASEDIRERYYSKHSNSSAYYDKHRLYLQEYNRKYKEMHIHECRAYNRSYHSRMKHTDKAKFRSGKSGAKHRGLGFNPINKKLPGYVWHHLHYDQYGNPDKAIVMAIPEELHKSIPHYPRTGKGMKEINDACWKWYMETVDAWL